MPIIAVDVLLLSGLNPGPWTGAGNNTYLLTGRVPTLIDAGVGDPRHLEAVASALVARGQELARVLVTHGHVDHASGSPALAARWPNAEFAKMPWPEVDSRLPLDWVPISNGERIQAGDGWLTAVHTPGHSPDHLCFLDEESETLFCGDLAILGTTVVIPASRGGSLVDYLASLTRIQALGPRRLLPAHGAPIEDPVSVLAGYLEHRRLRERQILGALGSSERLTTDEIVVRVYGAIPEELRGAARESALAHLAKLEDDGVAWRLDADWMLTTHGGPAR